MNKPNQTRSLVQGALLAAMYVSLTYLQNFIWPGSTSMAIQLRMAEALCVLAFFTPAAIPGLTLGCLIFNLSYSQSLPLDFLVGSLATALATLCMWLTRRVRLWGIPWMGLFMPALWNGLLVGWELTVFLSPEGFSWGLFGLNGLYVAIGEAVVLLLPGAVLYRVLQSRGLARRLFPESAA